MTAPILQPGDKVHIVTPTSLDDPAGTRNHEQLVALYRTQGVEVICTTAVANLPAYAVVAVFRATP